MLEPGGGGTPIIYTALCPFCASGDVFVEDGVYETGFYVSCNNCGAHGPVGAQNQDEALERWEHRPLKAEIRKIC